MRQILELTGRTMARVALLALTVAGATTASLDAAANPRVVMRTPQGDLVIEIYSHEAPISSGNFLTYVDDELFDGAHFYRVVTLTNQPTNDVKIEVVQGGLGFGDATRLPAIEHETTDDTGIRHLDGTLSMARLGPGTATSEFFICVGDQPDLDFGGARNPDGQGFAAFGRVIEGMEVVRAIQQGAVNGQMLIETVPITAVERLPAAQ